MKTRSWSISGQTWVDCCEGFIASMEDVIDEIKGLNKTQLQKWIKENNGDFKIID